MKRNLYCMLLQSYDSISYMHVNFVLKSMFLYTFISFYF
jgi:hypothetical protein